MLAAGTYVATEPRTWSEFTLRDTGIVQFTDARDGHKVYWHASGRDGKAWRRSMERKLAAGELVRKESV